MLAGPPPWMRTRDTSEVVLCLRQGIETLVQPLSLCRPHDTGMSAVMGETRTLARSPPLTRPRDVGGSAAIAQVAVCQLVRRSVQGHGTLAGAAVVDKAAGRRQCRHSGRGLGTTTGPLPAMRMWNADWLASWNRPRDASGVTTTKKCVGCLRSLSRPMKTVAPALVEANASFTERDVDIVCLLGSGSCRRLVTST